LTGFIEINTSDHKLGKHYFHMIAELNKMVFGAVLHFQCSATSLSGLSWSTASSTRPSISGTRTHVYDKGHTL